MMRFMSCIFTLFLFIGCGKKFPDYSPSPLIQEEEVPGYYSGQFKSLNGARIQAHAVAKVQGRQFYIRVVLMKGRSSVSYPQFVHYGSRCPDKGDDLNGNGLIESNELSLSTGPMLFPLDRNIRTESEGYGWFPRSNREGMFYYSRSADISELLKNLRTLKKIKNNDNLSMSERTIVLYQISSEGFLPVACAELKEDIDPENL